MITEAYRILRIRGKVAILCLSCDTLSFEWNDVLHRYCYACNIFLDELPDDYRRPPRTQRNLPGWQAAPANDPNHTPPEGA